MADKISFADLFNLKDSGDLEKAIKLISDMDKVYEKLSDGIKQESKAIEKALAENAKAAKELQNSYANLSKGTGKTKEATLEYVSTSEKLYNQQQELSKQQKVYISNLEQIKKEQDDVNKSSKELTNLNKDRIKLQERLNKLNDDQAQGEANLRIAIQQKNKQLKEAARESLGLISVYQKESKQLNDLRNKYKDVALTQGRNSKEARRLAKEVQHLDTRLKSVDASAGQFQRNVGNYPKVFKSAVVAISAGVIAVTGFVRAIGRSIQISRDYQDANATLAGILGVTTDKTERLRGQQLALGKSTEFSASQVAKAQTELARLGQSEENIIAMTPGILSAATALQTDLASAAELVAGQLNAFGLEAEESGRVADVLTKSTQISALNFERLSTALAIVSPAANAVNVSIEETTAILGAAADANIDASSAATALRNIYIDLSDKGLTWDDAMNRLNNSTDKLSTANELFGKRGAVVATVIASQTEKIDENTKSLENAAGTADEFARKQLDTLTGSLKLLSSAWEGFILSIENGEGPIGRFFKAAIDGATALLGLLTSANESLDDILDKQYESFLSENAKEEIKQLEGDFKRISESGVEITIEELAVERIDQLVKGTESLNDKFNNLTFEIEYTERQIAKLEEQGNASNFEDFLNLKENLELLKSERDDIKAQIDLRNNSIQALENYINKVINTNKEQKNLNESVEDGNNKFVRNVFVLNKLLNTQELLKKNLEELGQIYEVVFGETLEETEAAAEAANQAFLDRMDAEINAIADRYAKEREEAEKTAQLVAQYEQQKEQNYIDAAWAGVDAINGLFERRVQATEQELALLQEETDRKLELAADNEEGKRIIRERAAEQEKQLQAELAEERRKQAIFNKTIAIADIVINTSVGITKTIAQLGLPAALPFIISAGVLGAAQTAAVLAQPIPAFAEGTDNAPGGLAWVGEEGREIVLSPDRKSVAITPDEATLVDLPQGSQVLTNAIAENILGNDPVRANNTSNKELSNIIGTRINAENQNANIAKMLAKENDILTKQLKELVFNQPVNQFFMEDGDLKTAIKKGNTTIKGANKKYKFGRS